MTGLGSSGRILLISDNEETARYFMLFIDSYSVFLEHSAQGGLKRFKESEFDLIILKWGMPDMECGALIREFKLRDPDVPVVVITEENRQEIVQQLSHLGVWHILSKPFNGSSVVFVIQKGLELRQTLMANRRLVSILKEQNGGLQKQNFLLAKRVEDSTRNLSRLYEDLRATYLRTVRSLAQAIDARDHYTHSHSENVSRYAVAIARKLGFTVKDIQTVQEAAELHDIGKIGISDLVLLKPSMLTKEEWLVIKQHPHTGAQILQPLTFLNEVIELVRQHHERYDGSGYPDGLKGGQILLGSRILNVADAYDSMVSARSYRKIPLSREQAVAELLKNTGTQFDPKVVEAFLKILNEL